MRAQAGFGVLRPPRPDSRLNEIAGYRPLPKRSFNWISSLEEINFEIKQRFESEGIAMAYPTQTVYLINNETSRL